MDAFTGAADLVRVELRPFGHHVRQHFHVALQGENIAHRVGLVFTEAALEQRHGLFRQVERFAVPMKQFDGKRKVFQPRRRGRVAGFFHCMPADFRHRVRLNGGAQGFADQLSTQAMAQQGQAPPGGRADKGQFLLYPVIRIVGAHGAAHKDQRRGAVNIVGDRVIAVDRDQAIINVVPVEHVPQIARAFAGNVAENPNRLHNGRRSVVRRKGVTKMVLSKNRLVMVFFMVIVATGTGAFAAPDAQPDTQGAGARENKVVIEVAGILGAKVVLLINKQQRIQTAGDVTPEGVKVIDVDDDGATLEVDGQRDYYALGSSRISTVYTKPEVVEERIYKDETGMYRTSGFINGLPVQFLVDTGATSVAMNDGEARRLGIDYIADGEPAYVQTASGVAAAHRVKLKTIAVGKIKLSNIDAMVIEGDSLSEVLLGMSFLGRLQVKHENQVMSLEATL